VEYRPDKEKIIRNRLDQGRGRNESQGLDSRNYFYFFSIYACPSPNALTPTFESKFARIERLGDGKFALCFLRYTGKEWVGIFDALSVDECMKAIQDDAWFVP
jgi:hypothetical protein